LQGLETVRAILGTIKPQQAKEQLVGMLKDGELDQVVAILSEMSDSKRAKIIGEFKTPEENEMIGQVLEHLRKGGQLSELANEALNQAGVNRAAGS